MASSRGTAGTGTPSGGSSSASTAYLLRKSGSCRNCRHKHIQGRYCHVFVRDPSADLAQQSSSEGSSSWMRQGAKPSSLASTGLLTQTTGDLGSYYEDWLDNEEDVPGKVVKQQQSVLSSLAGGAEQLMQQGMQGLLSHFNKVRNNNSPSSPTNFESVPSSSEQYPSTNAPEAAEAAEGEAQPGGHDYYYGEDGVPYEEGTTWATEDEGAEPQQPLDESQWGEGTWQEEDQSAPPQPQQQQPELQGDELNVPAWVSAAGFMRCGCRQGVPRNSRAYTPVPETRYVDNLLIHMGHVDDEPARPGAAPTFPSPYAPYIMTFLSPGDMGRAAMAASMFREAAWRDPEYCDVSLMGVEQSFEAHDDYVEALVYRHPGMLYSCGDRRCKLWDLTTGQCAKVVFRDQTGIVAMRVEEPRFFWSFMSNGTFRKWKLTFKPGVMDFTALFGEHGGRVNDVALSPPSQGHCKRHTILNHNCFLYTCSDDRTAKVWDTSTNLCLATLTPPPRLSSTVRSLALSDRHLFLGSSRGQVFVYPLDRVCKRTDVHACKDPLVGPQPFCHQTTLQHGDSILRCLAVAGPSYSRCFLFSGSVDGSICVWRLPEAGLDFPLYALWQAAHRGAVSALAVSWNHLYSASADSTIAVWKLANHPSYVRRLQGNGQAIKSLCLTETYSSGSEDPEVVQQEAAGGSRLFAGLTTGLVIAFRIGTYG